MFKTDGGLMVIRQRPELVEEKTTTGKSNFRKNNYNVVSTFLRPVLRGSDSRYGPESKTYSWLGANS